MAFFCIYTLVIVSYSLLHAFFGRTTVPVCPRYSGGEPKEVNVGSQLSVLGVTIGRKGEQRYAKLLWRLLLLPRLQQTDSQRGSAWDEAGVEEQEMVVAGSVLPI
jgi:hypothetical protein